jgi:transposase
MGEIEPHCLGKLRDPARSGSDNRLFIEAVLWVVRTGSPWRDLPEHFGNWSSSFRRFSDWRKADVLRSSLRPAQMSQTLDSQWSMPQSSRSIVTGRAQKGDSESGHRPLEGGMTTKILALTVALGNLVRFELLPGHRFDTVCVEPLVKDVEFDRLIADKAFDSDANINDLNERGAKIVISQHSRRSTPLPLDCELYKWRYLIENFRCKLKDFKRKAMRADKTDESFSAIIHLAAAVIKSR